MVSSTASTVDAYLESLPSDRRAATSGATRRNPEKTATGRAATRRARS